MSRGSAVFKTAWLADLPTPLWCRRLDLNQHGDRAPRGSEPRASTVSATPAWSREGDSNPHGFWPTVFETVA